MKIHIIFIIREGEKTKRKKNTVLYINMQTKKI